LKNLNTNKSTQQNAKDLNWYKEEARKGDAEAMYHLGWMYNSGEGVTQDYNIAKKWYEEAAQKGNAYAMYSLGFQYEVGKEYSLEDKLEICRIIIILPQRL